MRELLQYAASGVTVGAVYALIGLGFTLVYNASGIVNFAQGEFVMLGGMTTVALVAAGVPLWAAAPAAAALVAALGLLLYLGAIAPARGASQAGLIIITIGASILAKGGAQVAFGKQFHRLAPFSGDRPIPVLGAAVQPQAFWVVGGMAATSVAFYVFLTFTLTGKSLRATAANRIAAQLVGISIRRVMLLAFGLSAAIGAVAGILVTPISLTSYDVGTALALKGFAAAMLGGLGSPFGAVVGGLLLGLMETLAAGYVSSAYKDAVAFLSILLVLLAAPQGLLGSRSAERV